MNIKLKSLLFARGQVDKAVFGLPGEIDGHLTLSFGLRSGIMDLHHTLGPRRRDTLWVGRRDELVELLSNRAVLALLLREMREWTRPVTPDELATWPEVLMDLSAVDGDRLLRIAAKKPFEEAVCHVVGPTPQVLPAELLAHQLGAPHERSFAVFERGTEELRGVLSQRETPEGWKLLYVDTTEVMASADRFLSLMTSLALRLDRPEVRAEHARSLAVHLDGA